jgi:Protein of unknown function (DUF3987)
MNIKWMEDAKPHCRRKIIKNATVEATAQLLSENPDGLLYHCDELASLFGGMDAYKARRGADRPFWLEAKEGKPYSVDRKTSDTLVVENCAVSILGGIQPDKIRPLVPDLATDGMLQRFLPIFLKRHGDGVDEYPDKELDKIISELAIVITNAETRGRFRFAPDAAVELDRLLAFKNQQLARSDAAPKLKEWLNKMPNEFGRIALVFHFIQWAALPADQRGFAPPETIPLATAQMARRYLTEFVYSHAWEFYGRMLGRSAGDDHAAWIAEFILTRGLPKITRRDVQRNYSALKSADKHGQLTAAMQVLELQGWVKPIKWHDKVPKVWAVNLAVHDGRFAEITEAERRRRTEARENIAQEAERRRQ